MSDTKTTPKPAELANDLLIALARCSDYRPNVSIPCGDAVEQVCTIRGIKVDEYGYQGKQPRLRRILLLTFNRTLSDKGLACPGDGKGKWSLTEKGVAEARDLEDFLDSFPPTNETDTEAAVVDPLECHDAFLVAVAEEAGFNPEFDVEYGQQTYKRIAELMGMSIEDLNSEFGPDLDEYFGNRHQDLIDNGLMGNNLGRPFLTQRGLDQANKLMRNTENTEVVDKRTSEEIKLEPAEFTATTTSSVNNDEEEAPAAPDPEEEDPSPEEEESAPEEEAPTPNFICERCKEPVFGNHCLHHDDGREEMLCRHCFADNVCKQEREARQKEESQEGSTVTVNASTAGGTAEERLRHLEQRTKKGNGVQKKGAEIPAPAPLDPLVESKTFKKSQFVGITVDGDEFTIAWKPL